LYEEFKKDRKQSLRTGRTMSQGFEFDRVLRRENICNLEQELFKLSRICAAGECVKIYGRRNFGKTSLVTRAVAEDWHSDISGVGRRVVVYVDLYSVRSLSDISREFTKAFNLAISRERSLWGKGVEWMKALKKVRPIWQPPVSSDEGMGSFSLTTEAGEPVVDFELVMENIAALAEAGDFEFLLILDEFQEVGRVERATGKLRGALQTFPGALPVVIMGSKYHLLQKIFLDPREPFHGWGHTIEFGPIDYVSFHEYMNVRFAKFSKEIDLTTSRFLQDLMDREPEAINRLCSAIALDETLPRVISKEIVTGKLGELLESSRSIYSERFAQYTKLERRVLEGFAREGVVRKPTGKDFVRKMQETGASSIQAVIERFLDNGVIYREQDDDGKNIFRLSDPLFALYLKQYKVM
jgi:hypothetical protein